MRLQLTASLHYLTRCVTQNLFASHPDWCLHVPGRPQQISRNQMVLDLSRPEVRNYVFQSLAAILSR